MVGRRAGTTARAPRLGIDYGRDWRALPAAGSRHRTLGRDRLGRTVGLSAPVMAFWRAMCKQPLSVRAFGRPAVAGVEAAPVRRTESEPVEWARSYTLRRLTQLGVTLAGRAVSVSAGASRSRRRERSPDRALDHRQATASSSRCRPSTWVSSSMMLVNSAPHQAQSANGFVPVAVSSAFIGIPVSVRSQT